MAGLERLEFLLDLDAKVDGAVKLLGVLDRSIASLHKVGAETTKVEAALGKLDKASAHGAETHKKHAGAAINLGHAFEGAKEKVHGLLEAMGLMLVFEGVHLLAEKVVELGSEILAAAGKAERAEKSFKLLLGADAGSELLEYVEGIAKHTEFTADELKSVTQSLLKAGFAAKDIPRALGAGLDIAAFGGNAEQGLAGALEALEKLKRTGNIDDRKLGELGLGKADFLAELSKRTGVGVKTLTKQLDAGKVDVNESLEALYSLIAGRTGKDLGAAGVDMSTGLQARIKHLEDVPDEMFQALSKTEAFDHLSKKLGGLLEMLEGPVGEKLAGSLEKLFTAAVNLVEQVDFAKWGDRVSDFLDKLPGRLETAGEVLEAFGKVFAFVSWAVQGIGTDLGELAAKLYLFPGQVLDAAKAIGKAIWEGVRDGIMAGLTAVTDAVDSLGGAIVGKLKGVLGIHSPSVVFEGMGRMSGEGYVQGLDSSADRIDAAINRSLSMPDSVPAGAFARPVGGGAAPGPIQVTVNITTHVGPGGNDPGGAGSAEQIGAEVAKQVEAILPTALQSAFQRMGQEAGS